MGYAYVRTGIYENGYFRVTNKLRPMDQEKFEQECKKLEPYLISLNETATRSYDDSDDERVVPSTSYSSKCKYRELNPRKNAEHLLVIDDKIIGVVFTVTSGNNKYYRAFSFDGKIAQTMRLGYSASHSSSFQWVEGVSLAKRGTNGIPQTEKEAKFVQNEMFPSL